MADEAGVTVVGWEVDAGTKVVTGRGSALSQSSSPEPLNLPPLAQTSSSTALMVKHCHALFIYRVNTGV